MTKLKKKVATSRSKSSASAKPASKPAKATKTAKLKPSKLLAKSTAKKGAKVDPKAVAKPAPKANLKATPKVLAKSVKTAALEAASKKSKAAPVVVLSKAELKAKAKLEVKAAKESAKAAKLSEKLAAKAAKDAAKAAAKADKKNASGKVLQTRSRKLEILCREIACELGPTTGDYCRMHYIKNWKRIKTREKIIEEGKLNRFIEELVAKYPERYIEAIRIDLSSDNEFIKVIRDLDLDESIDETDADSDQNDAPQAEEGIIDSIKREIEGDTELF